MGRECDAKSSVGSRRGDVGNGCRGSGRGAEAGRRHQGGVGGGCSGAAGGFGDRLYFAGGVLDGGTPEEKRWATGIEGGVQPGTERESYEGAEPRRMRVQEAFWMGRTEVTVGQFRRFVESPETAG